MNANILIVFQSFTMLFCFISLFVLLNRDLKLQQRQIEYVLFGCAIADIGMLIEVISAGDLSIIMVGKGVQVIGISLFMLSLVALTGHICGMKVPVWFTTSLLVVDTLLTLAHFTDKYNSLFYQETHLVDYSGYKYMAYTLGPAGILYWLISIAFPGLSCLAMLIYSATQDSNRNRRNEFITLGVAFGIAPVILWLYNMGWVTPFYDPTMMVASYVTCYLAFSKWKNQGIDIVAAAAQTAIDSISAGVITLNQYKEIIYFNEAAREVLPELNYYLGVSIETIDSLYMPELKAGQKGEFNYNNRRYYVSLTAIKEDNGQIVGYAILFNDMTEMFTLMERIREERKRADEASQVKSQFLANISHEIRTPMNAIMGLSDLIIEESRGRKVYDMAVTIKKATMSLLDLVNNVLDVSKLETGKMELTEDDYSLQSLVLDIMKVMEISAAQHGLALKCNIDESLPCMLRGDSGKIRQCLINLINNGIKFTNEGYVRVDVSGIRRGDKVTLTFMVIDTGVGIKEQDLERLFGAFEQVDLIVNKGKEGSGLGLSITKSLVELMGGVIDVSSIYGAGTTFSIRLSQEIVNDTPISAIKEIVDNVTEEQKMFSAPDIKVLLVDDNKVNLMVAKGFLTPYNFQIDTATSGEEAVKLVMDKQYDLIFMDHMMPGMDGVEAVRLIHEFNDPKGYKPYIIALTANAFGNIKDMFLSHGFNDFLSKPIDKKALHSVLLKSIPDEKRNFVEEELKEEEYTEDELAELFMEGVDVRGAFEQRGCNQEEYVELLELYALEGAEKLQTIKTAFENKDWKNYSIHTHGLKSASINIGAMDLSERAKKHEFASKDENAVDVDFIMNDAEGLLAQYQGIIDEANRVVAKYKNDHVEIKNVEKPELEPGKFGVLVNEALSLSEAFRSKEAAEKVDEILTYNLDPDMEKKLSDIRMKYKLYDDDGAEDLLHEIIDNLEK